MRRIGRLGGGGCPRERRLGQGCPSLACEDQLRLAIRCFRGAGLRLGYDRAWSDSMDGGQRWWLTTANCVNSAEPRSV